MRLPEGYNLDEIQSMLASLDRDKANEAAKDLLRARWRKLDENARSQYPNAFE